MTKLAAVVLTILALELITVIALVILFFLERGN